MNLINICVLIASLVQSGAVGVKLSSNATFKWASTSEAPYRELLAWDGTTGQPTRWDKELFPVPPKCSNAEAVNAMNEVACDPRIDGMPCHRQRIDAALRVCGAKRQMN